MNYPITKNYLKYNRSYQALNAQGAVAHSTDDPGASDEAEDEYFNSGYRAASAHAFIDSDSITETIPLNEVAWGSGPTSNHKFLQIELCMPKSHNAAQFQEIWNRAVFYFANCFINVIKVTTVTKDNLLSHAEVSAKWKETDHTDPVAYFKEYGKTVDDFRAAVQTEINEQIKPKEVFEVKNIVVYGNDVDKHAAFYLADFLCCPMMDGCLPFDYSKCENVYCIGGEPTLVTTQVKGWTGYATKKIAGAGRRDTCRAVLDFIATLETEKK